MPSQLSSSQNQPIPEASNDNGTTTSPTEPVLELGERRIRIVSDYLQVCLIGSLRTLLRCRVFWGPADGVCDFHAASTTPNASEYL